MSLLTKVATDIAAEQQMKETAKKLAENIKSVLAEREGIALQPEAERRDSTLAGDAAHIGRCHRVGHRPKGGAAEHR